MIGSKEAIIAECKRDISLASVVNFVLSECLTAPDDATRTAVEKLLWNACGIAFSSGLIRGIEEARGVA